MDPHRTSFPFGPVRCEPRKGLAKGCNGQMWPRFRRSSGKRESGYWGGQRQLCGEGRPHLAAFVERLGRKGLSEKEHCPGEPQR